MGGIVPLGYGVEARSLVVDPEPARLVREIYARYLEFGCVRRLKQHVDRLITAGAVAASRRPMSRGALYTVLKNPIYVGKISHKGEVFDGQHEPIVDEDAWHRTQELLAKNRQGRHRRANAKAPSLLAGLVFDAQGEPMVAVHATKASRRYRYYVSKSLHAGNARQGDGACRVSAHQLEAAVAARICQTLRSERELLDAMSAIGSAASEQAELVRASNGLADRWESLAAADRGEFFSACLSGVIVEADAIRLRIARAGLHDFLLDENRESSPRVGSEATFDLEVPAALTRRGLETRLVVSGTEEPSGHPRTVNALRDALEKALAWNEELLSGHVASMSAIAKREAVTQRYVAHLIKLAFLAPDIMTAIIRGKVPADLSLDRLKKGFPLDWAEQRAVLGFPARPAR